MQNIGNSKKNKTRKRLGASLENDMLNLFDMTYSFFLGSLGLEVGLRSALFRK